MVNYDPEYPLSDEEVSKLEHFIASYERWRRTECGLCPMSDLGKRVEVQIVASRD